MVARMPDDTEAAPRDDTEAALLEAWEIIDTLHGCAMDDDDEFFYLPAAEWLAKYEQFRPTHER